MNYCDVNKIDLAELKGRAVKKVVGRDSVLTSEKMTFGMTRFSQQYGSMDPHYHAEELIYVLDCQNAITRYGDTADCQEGTVEMHPGMLLQFADGEWHVFEFTKSDGYANILFFYGQVDNIRPDDQNGMNK